MKMKGGIKRIMEIDNFKEEFMRQLNIQMAGAGRVLGKAEIVIIDEFVKQAKANGLDLVRAKKD